MQRLVLYCTKAPGKPNFVMGHVNHMTVHGYHFRGKKVDSEPVQNALFLQQYIAFA